MRMTFLCGYCQATLAADSAHAGLPVECPYCRAVLEVPAPPDPGFEYVDEPEVDEERLPPPKRKAAPTPEREPEPRRSSSTRPLRRRPRRASQGLGAGAKAAFITVAVLLVIGGGVVIALLAAPNGKVGVAPGGVLPALGGGPEVPLGHEVECRRLRFRLPSGMAFMEKPREVVIPNSLSEDREFFNGQYYVHCESERAFWAHKPFDTEEEFQKHWRSYKLISSRQSQIRVSGYVGLEVTSRIRGMDCVLRKVFSPEAIYTLSVTGEALSLEAKWLHQMLDSLTIR